VNKRRFVSHDCKFFDLDRYKSIHGIRGKHRETTILGVASTLQSFYLFIYIFRRKINEEKKGNMTETEEALTKLVQPLRDDPEAVVILGKRKA